MNSNLEMIYTRCSCRAFDQRPVAREDLEAIVKAGQSAPSGMGRRQWHFSVLTAKYAILELGQLAYGKLDQYFYASPAVILVTYDKDSPFALQDTGCAMEAMMLACHALGLGSVWCNAVTRIPSLEGKLGVPAAYRATASLAVGYPKTELAKRPYPVDNVTFI